MNFFSININFNINWSDLKAMLFVINFILIENNDATEKIDFVLLMHYLAEDQLFIFSTGNKRFG